MSDAEPEIKLVPPGSAWHLALQFTATEHRRPVRALLGLRGELLDAALGQREPAIAQMRLAWWREEILRLDKGQARHPVGQAVAAVMAESQLEGDYLLELLDGIEMDLEGTQPADESGLMLYLHRNSGVLHELIAQVCGLNDATRERGVRKYAQCLGQGVRLVEIARDLQSDARSGRCYVPATWMAESGVDLADLTRSEARPGLDGLLRRICDEAGTRLATAAAALPAGERPRQRTGLVLLSLYTALGREIAKRGSPPARTGAPTGLGAVLRAWNAARRAANGKLHEKPKVP